MRVVDTSTGSQIGDTFTAPDLASLLPLLNASGSRVTVLSQDDTTGGSPAVTMYAINTATGRQIGQTITLPGRMGGPPYDQSISTSGDRAVIVTRDLVGAVRAVVFDTTTGTRRIGDHLPRRHEQFERRPGESCWRACDAHTRGIQRQ